MGQQTLKKVSSGKRAHDSDDSREEQGDSDSDDADAKLGGVVINSNKPRIERTSSIVQKPDPEKDDYDSDDSNRAALF